MHFKKESELPSSGGTFLRLKDGESVTGIFRGDVFEFYQKWVENNGKRESVVCEPTEKGASFRFRINFVTYENGAFVSKLFEQGKTVYLQLGDLNEECPLPTTKVKITRKGAGKNDTTYSIVPILREPLSPAQLKAIGEVKLQSLSHDAAAKAKEEAQPPPDETPWPPSHEDEIPF